MRYVFSAHAQLPEGTDIYKNYKFITIVVQVDIEDGKIFDCVIPMYSRLQNQFVSSVFLGNTMNDIDKIIDIIDEKLHTPCKRALITAIQSLNNRYMVIREAPQRKIASEE